MKQTKNVSLGNMRCFNIYRQSMRGDIDRKRSQNAQPQNEILRLKGGLGALPSTSKFVAVDSHKHCLRQYASLKNVVFDNYAQTAFYRYNYANKGLNFILVSDKMILTNGGVPLERSGRKIAVFAGKCQAVPG